MKLLSLILLMLIVVVSYGQNGYVKLSNDSIVAGYLRPYVSYMDGHQGIELWRTKKDKSPLKIPKAKISEYAIKKDTTALFRDFYPFEGEEYHVESIEAIVLISKGKVKLYSATLGDYKKELMVLPSTTGMSATYGKVPYSIYIVKDEENNLIGIKSDRSSFLKTIQRIIVKDKELLKRVENEELKFKDTEQIIRIYNLK